MVQFVEDEQRGSAPAGAPKDVRRETDLLIGHDGAMEIAGFDGLLVRQRRIQLNAHQTGSGRPLCAQMIRRADHEDTDGHSIGQVLMGNFQRKASFPCRRRRHGKKIWQRMGEDAGHGARLPLAQLGRPGRQGHRSSFSIIIIIIVGTIGALSRRTGRDSRTDTST